MNKPEITEAVWSRIASHAGETFHQMRGKPFTYAMNDIYIELKSTNQNIPKKHIAEALKLVPLQNTVPVQHLRAPSYIYAILTDPRIRVSEW